MLDISLTDHKQTLASLPSLPGVYRYFDASGQCLYVGKARNLKKRVSQYFKTTGNSPRIELMVQKIRHLEVTVVRTEAEALLLENNLIKALNPKYNILFRDDKSYPYLRITEETFGRASYYRGHVDRKHHYFGPYPNAQAVREAIVILQKVFGLRTCEDSVFKNRSRACLTGQMGRCSAPCVGMITPEAYQERVKEAMAFLRGRADDVVQRLRQEMLEASERRDYEKAIVCRDRIALLGDVMHQQTVETTGGDVNADILAVAILGDTACLNLAIVRGGRHLGDHAMFPHIGAEKQSEVSADEIIQAFVVHHYRELTIPDVVIAPQVQDPQGLAEILSEMAERKIAVVHEPTAVRRQWAQMCEQGAQLALSRQIGQASTMRARLVDLAKVLSLDESVVLSETFTVECFDISHTAGEATQASCVVFEGGRMNGAKYRRFNIQGVTEGDDYAAMRQVLERRYQAVACGQARMPEVVLVDGGAGQVNMAIDVFNQLGLDISHIVGVAKGEGRKTGLETLIFADGREPQALGVHSPALMLVAMIRDEAHRFAITGMRAKRSKARQVSRLEDIDGIGTKRRQLLLSHFGGFRGVANASVEDLIRIKGISRAMAQKIYSQLHGADRES